MAAAADTDEMSSSVMFVETLKMVHWYHGWVDATGAIEVLASTCSVTGWSAMLSSP